MIGNVIKGWKTTLLGVLVILATLASIFVLPGHITWWPQGFAGIGIGTILMFTPDTLIDLIKRFIGAKTDNADK